MSMTTADQDQVQGFVGRRRRRRHSPPPGQISPAPETGRRLPFGPIRVSGNIVLQKTLQYIVVLLL